MRHTLFVAVPWILHLLSSPLMAQEAPKGVDERIGVANVGSPAGIVAGYLFKESLSALLDGPPSRIDNRFANMGRRRFIEDSVTTAGIMGAGYLAARPVADALYRPLNGLTFRAAWNLGGWKGFPPAGGYGMGNSMRLMDVTARNALLLGIPLVAGLAAVQLARGEFSATDLAISAGSFMTASAAVDALLLWGTGGASTAWLPGFALLGLKWYLGDKAGGWVHSLLEGSATGWVRSGVKGIRESVEALLPD